MLGLLPDLWCDNFYSPLSSKHVPERSCPHQGYLNTSRRYAQRPKSSILITPLRIRVGPAISLVARKMGSYCVEISMNTRHHDRSADLGCSHVLANSVDNSAVYLTIMSNLMVLKQNCLLMRLENAYTPSIVYCLWYEYKTHVWLMRSFINVLLMHSFIQTM